MDIYNLFSNAASSFANFMPKFLDWVTLPVRIFLPVDVITGSIIVGIILLSAIIWVMRK